MANTAVHGSKYLGYNSFLSMLNRATAKYTAIPTFAALGNDIFRQKLHYGPIERLVGVLRGRTTTSQEQSGIRQSMVDVLQQVEHSCWVTTPYGFASITLAFAVHVTNIDCILQAAQVFVSFPNVAQSAVSMSDHTHRQNKPFIYLIHCCLVHRCLVG